MPESLPEWAEEILGGDRRAIARAISAVESGEPAGIELVKLLFRKSGHAYVVGITGSPGAGKSTLVEKLAAEYRSAGVRIGIIAVDPTSPFSGGAILGDRIRMQALSADEGVYIRSMATRGHLGGLAAPVQDVVTILDAAGCQVILIETVGVGQDEVEIARHADVTVLLLVPGMGDDVQTFKAGVMEIADLYVVNKADRPEADRVEQEVRAMLGMSERGDDWKPPVLRTVATTGEGVSALREALERFRNVGQQDARRLARRREQWRGRLLELLRQSLFESALGELDGTALNSCVEDVLAQRRDPHTLAEQMVRDFRRGKGATSKE
jgi:LAO/AO transport system kinase